MAIALPLSAAEKMTIAVMDFNAQDVPRAEAVKVSELIRNEMVNSGRYVVLERAQVGKILKEQGFQMTGCTDVTCAVQVGKLLSARKILVGTVMKFGNNVAVTGRVVDVEKGIAELSEKERAISKDDEFYMVERFCDKLTYRITGRTLYKKDGSYVNTPNYRSPSSPLYLHKDPTLWLSVASGISSLIVFAVGENDYKVKSSRYFKEEKIDFFYFTNAPYIIGWSGPYALFGTNYFIEWGKTRTKIHKLKNYKEVMYITSGSLGGFAAAMLLTFIGRSIYYAVNFQVDSYNSNNNVDVFIPSQYFSVVDWMKGKPCFGLGMSMRF
ncbi:MAG: hypothetical protein KA369_22460 [Spirochaetes bacterium]|nr:hypothetical protein [Spirochaetota bacterium]